MTNQTELVAPATETTTPSSRGYIMDSLVKKPEEVRRNRGKKIANDLHSAFKAKIDEYASALDQITAKKKELLDVAPNTTYIISQQVDAVQITEDFISLIKKELELLPVYEKLVKEYEEMFGMAYTKIVLQF